MTENLKGMMKRHQCEIDQLRACCKHHQNNIKVRKDHSCVGMGSAYPSIHVTCRNCGTVKIMFIGHTETKVKIERTLKRQSGIKDQRLDCCIQYEWELD